MEGYKCNIGKGILKICMGDNYTDATVVFREYVQNAIDAIYQAESMNLISDTDNYVSINTQSGNVTIMDRGIGVKAEQIGPVLVDLGNSQKTTSDIGQYGIGRLSGANWCDRIVFETSYHGENVCSVLAFDSKLARELVAKDDFQDCGDIMDKVTTYESKPEACEEHYFRVTLENVKDELRDEDAVRNYLSFIAPVPYDDSFYDDCQKKAFLQYPEFKQLSDNEKVCKVHLNGKPVVKPYMPTIYLDSKSLKITPPSFFKISDEDFGDLAWGWYSINEESRQMGEGVNYKGLRLRAKNMAVGTQDYLISCFKNPTDANYVFGEVFVISDKIQPTGSRDGIKSSKEYTELQIRLKKKFKEINTVYNSMSKLGSSALGPIIKAMTTIDEKSIELKSSDLAEEEKAQIKNEIKQNRETVAKAKQEIPNKIKSVQEAENADLIFELIKKHWAKEAQKLASSINAKAKPGQKIDPVNVDSVIMSAVQCNQPTNNDNNKVSKAPLSYSPKKPKSEVEPKETDLYRQLGIAEYKLMKKVYQVLNAETRLDEKTKERIKSKLVKKILAQ